MKLLTILCDDTIDYNNKDVAIVKTNNQNIRNIIRFSNSKYFLYIKNYENTAPNFIDKVVEKCEKEFDACAINYSIEIDEIIRNDSEYEEYDLKRKPYAGSYFWSYIFKVEKILKLLESFEKSSEKVDELFKDIECISDVLYNHVPSEPVFNNFIYVDEKKVEHYKNVFYVGDYCNGRFNGYITWLNNIGRCFGDKYEMVVLTDKILDTTRKRFEQYFKVVTRNEDTNYLCDRLLVTYSTYYYPKNIICTDQNYLFIHGNMSDYPNTRKYYKDIYTKYIAVSKIAMEKASGYFPTEEIDYINNPIKITDDLVKPHLKLVSAQREAEVKKTDRIKKIAKILDKEKIPYTWNLFTDSATPDKIFGGLVYRKPIDNPIPYINDADYFVQLSDSEAYSYSVLEAIYLNTKVVVTPLECYDEMKIDKDSSIIIPFEYFDDENEDKLRECVLRMYENIDKQYVNGLDDSQFERYNELLIK